MKQCPKCGRYLRFKLAYNCGAPIVGYDCICGYDSFKNEHTIVTDATNTLAYWSNTSNIEEKQNDNNQ